MRSTPALPPFVVRSGPALALALGVLAGGVAGGCGHKTAAVNDAEPPAPAPAPTVDQAAVAAEARRALVASSRAAVAAGTYTGPRIGAMNMNTSVLSELEWPESRDGGSTSVRLGYLRHGAKVPVIAEPIVNTECPDGWYELVEGGYVCGKYATLDLKNPRVRLAPHPPDTQKALPYQYGYNITNGTPLYRRVLSIEDRKKYEPWLTPKPAPVEAPVAEGESAAPAEDPLDAGAPPPPPAVERAEKAEPIDASVPWYMREYDGGRPQVGLDDLRGRGVLVRRMVRGFFLALDRDFKAAHAHWWRTTAGFAVPFDRVVVQKPLSDFHGAWFGGAADVPVDAGADPIGDDAGDAATQVMGPKGNGAVAFVLTTYAHKVLIDVEKKKVGWGEAIPKRTALELTGATFTSGGVAYAETTAGFWVRPGDVKLANVMKPADLAPGEKWIDVDVTLQTLVAFEGDRPVFATLVSSGKRNLVDKDKDRPTPPGTYRIREKHISATMDGDVAADGPYSIEDVPWVMYFQGSYALHGAFWHGQFGRTMSHGCVNLSPADARTIFGWVEPRLPDGWHGVFATEARPGTRVVIHE
jgi:hypothetical protein